MTSFRDAFKRHAGASGMRVAVAAEPAKPDAAVANATPVSHNMGVPRPPKRK